MQGDAFAFICSYNRKLYYSIVVFVLHATLLDKSMLQLPRMQCQNDNYAKMVPKYWNVFEHINVQKYALE